MPEHYTDFATVVRSGLLPIQVGASAFRIKHALIVNVFLGDFSQTATKDIKGSWTYRIRADASTNVNGKPVGTILFEQSVEWTARVTALADPLTGIGLVTWQPLGDGGSGKQQTSVCQVQPCPTVPDINNATAQQLADYGASGAWRFLDTPINVSNETPAQKYAVEEGFTIFQEEGAATVGTYQFFADWESANYLCEVPEGAFFEVVHDTWQNGTLDRQASYSFSYKSALLSVTVSLMEPRSGQSWFLYLDSGTLKCARTRHLAADIPLISDTSHDYISTVTSTRTRFANLHRLNDILIAILDSGGLEVLVSVDDGQTWANAMDIVQNVIVLATASNEDGSLLYIYGQSAVTEVDNAKPASELLNQNDIIRCVLKCQGASWVLSDKARISTATGVNLPTKDIAKLECAADRLRLTYRDGNDFRVLESTDGLKSLQAVNLS